MKFLCHPISDWEQSDPHVDYRFVLTRVGKCENLTRIREKNIENIVRTLNFDLETYVINWNEFKDLQLAYLKASVVDIEAITDHAITGSLYKIAHKNNFAQLLHLSLKFSLEL